MSIVWLFVLSGQIDDASHGGLSQALFTVFVTNMRREIFQGHMWSQCAIKAPCSSLHPFSPLLNYHAKTKMSFFWSSLVFWCGFSFSTSVSHTQGNVALNTGTPKAQYFRRNTSVDQQHILTCSKLEASTCVLVIGAESKGTPPLPLLLMFFHPLITVGMLIKDFSWQAHYVSYSALMMYSDVRWVFHPKCLVAVWNLLCNLVWYNYLSPVKLTGAGRIRHTQRNHSTDNLYLLPYAVSLQDISVKINVRLFIKNTAAKPSHRCLCSVSISETNERLIWEAGESSPVWSTRLRCLLFLSLQSTACSCWSWGLAKRWSYYWFSDSDVVKG